MPAKRLIGDPDDLEVAIATALHNAATPWEQKFIADIKNRYDLYGMEIILPKKAALKLLELQEDYKDRKPIKK